MQVSRELRLQAEWVMYVTEQFHQRLTGATLNGVDDDEV